MASSGIFAVVDVGSANIKTLVGNITQNAEGEDILNIIGVGNTKSQGIRKGTILDMDEFKKNLDAALTEAEQMSGQPFADVTLCIAGTSLQIHRNKGMIAVPSDEISDEDVSRVLDMAQNGLTLTNQEILKIIPESFTVDLEARVKSPVGMAAKKLEVLAHVFSVSTNTIGNVRKGLADIGINTLDIYPSLLSSPEGVLSRRQKELGVVCIDVGSSTTSMSVYEEGVLIHSAVIPVGGEYATSDVALGTRISVDIAEKIKIDYGDLLLIDESKPKDEEIRLSRYDKKEEETVSKVYLSQILQARYKEIFHLINQELKLIGKDGMLPEGAVFVGGGCKVKGLIDLAKEELRLPCMIGQPTEHEFISGTTVGDPMYASSVGTLLLIMKYGQGKRAFKLNLGGVGGTLKKLFSSLMP